MKEMRIGEKLISDTTPPYVIAEVGMNHEGVLAKAINLIDLAKEGGADAVKFQTYKADTLASKNSPYYWDLKSEPTESQYELFKKYDKFGNDEYLRLCEHSKKVGIDFLSTPFDDDAVDFLAPLMPCFKVASADITNIPMLRRIAKKGLPVLLSTGASTIPEIDIAVRELEAGGVRDIVVLHCILNYPLKYEHANLRMIGHLRQIFPDKVVGYSDHCVPDKGMMVLATSFLYGARVIEKHFTHDKTLPGNDHYHAMDVHDLKEFRKQLTFMEMISGAGVKRPLASEDVSRKNARRSIVTKQAIKAGSFMREEDLTYKRPGTGISPLYWDEVIGKKVRVDLPEDHILQFSDVEG